MKRKKLLWGLGIVFGLLVVLFLLRVPIMRGIANYLMYEDGLAQADAIVVLSGGAYDRGTLGADLFQQGYAPLIICTGGNFSPDLKAVGTEMLESDVTAYRLQELGVAENNIELIHEGSSTAEEAEIILAYCQQNGLDEIIIVSHKFHTKRVKQVFKKKLKKEGITVIIQGASSSMYDEKNWWQSEYGLLALNNEYVKQLYYIFK